MVFDSIFRNLYSTCTLKNRFGSVEGSDYETYLQIHCVNPEVHAENIQSRLNRMLWVKFSLRMS